MRSNTSHCTALVQVINHVQDKSIIGSLTWCKPSCFAETIISIEFVGSTPFCRERRICNYSIKLSITKRIPFKCITILNLEVAESDAMKQHIHSGKVISCRILFLSININCISDIGSTKKQRATTASRVIYIAQTLVSDGNNFC